MEVLVLGIIYVLLPLVPIVYLWFRHPRIELARYVGWLAIYWMCLLLTAKSAIYCVDRAWDLPAVFLGLAFLFGVLAGPLLAAKMIERERRARPPEVCQCGYNLYGNVSGVCPECGTPVPDIVRTADTRDDDQQSSPR